MDGCDVPQSRALKELAVAAELIGAEDELQTMLAELEMLAENHNGESVQRHINQARENVAFHADKPGSLLPESLAEGVPKQDDADLRTLQNWIDDLLEYSQDVAAEDIDAGEGETIEAVEESSGGTVVIKKVSCGKDNCKCQSGELHSPYKYIVRRQGDSLDWEYKGAVTE
jgi:hypothetical protein